VGGTDDCEKLLASIFFNVCIFSAQLILSSKFSISFSSVFVFSSSIKNHPFNTTPAPIPNPYHPIHKQNNLKEKAKERTDVGNGRSNTDFDTRVTLLSKLALEELVQLGVEDTVRHELSALRHSSLDSSHFDVSFLAFI